MPGTVPTAVAPAGRMILYIPQTDQSALSWIKLFEKYPKLRMVIAMSPRFTRFAKEPALKDQMVNLQKAGRLELAVQIPNAPFLPLIINTEDARLAVPAGAPLPNPPFAHPDDATQIIAKARAEFAKAWGAPPKGLVLPLGAVNTNTLKVINPLGLDWVVAAVGGPNSGLYRSGRLLVLDATPTSKSDTVQVWDERVFGNPDQSLKSLSTWIQDALKSSTPLLLPTDPGLNGADLPTTWGNRTWNTPDWTPWVGSPTKNAAWGWLRTTREALEKYKNSGQASVRRLDMAFEEIFNAENANYFSGLTEGESTFTLSEEREREFKATLSSVFRMIGEAPPDNLFSHETVTLGSFKASSSTITWESLADGRGHLTITDPPNDANGDGQLADPAGESAVSGVYDLRKLEVFVGTESLDWVLTLGSLKGATLGTFESTGALIDVYLDVNGQPNVGTSALLSGRGARARSSDAWEYGFSLWGTQAHFYRTRGAEGFDLSETMPLTLEGNQIRFSTPRTWLRGNPQRWGYQALVMIYDPKSLENDVRPLMTPEMQVAHRLPIFDLIDPLDIPQGPLMLGLEDKSRSGLPFLRLAK